MAADTGERATPSRHRYPPVVYLYLGIIVLTWAVNWPLMKLALGAVPPFTFVLLRLVGSLALLGPVLLARGRRLIPEPGERLALFWVSQGQIAGFLVFSIIGLSILPAGRAIVLAYTMPLWAIPIGLFLWPESYGKGQLAGAAIGFLGLVLFMNPGLVDWGNAKILAGNAVLLAAAIAWALGSCLYRRRRWRTAFWVQNFWQLLVSVPPVAILAAWQGGTVHWTRAAIAILAYNAAVTTALGYFLWNSVLSVMPAATAGQVLTLTPVGGFILSLAIFGGSVSADFLASVVLIVAGIFVTLRR